jgi:hypothetical protein
MDTLLQSYEVIKLSTFLCHILAASLTIVGTVMFSFGSVLLMQKPNTTFSALGRTFHFTTLWWSGNLVMLNIERQT